MEHRPATPIRVGARLGPYLLLQKLGRGGSGTVYLAENSNLGTRVALKVLNPAFASGGAGTARLKREIMLTKRIVHPGVCRVFDLHIDPDVQYVAMEYIPGLCLEEIIEVEGVVEMKRAVRAMRAVCRALHAAHKVGIVHRDIKPGNIMLGPNDAPTLVDFGSAIHESEEPLGVVPARPVQPDSQ